MAHWLCIRVPQLPLEIFSRSVDEEQPLAVSDGDRYASVLLCNPAARSGGICAGMPVAAARALVHDLIVRPRDHEAEYNALHSLAAWAYQYSSQISLHPPYALLLELQGSLTLFGGRAALLKIMREGLSELGYETQLASAPTPLAALSLARCNCQHGIEQQHLLPAALAPLPVSVLDWDQQLLDRLEGMGVRRLGDLLPLPRDGLARRLGQKSLDYLDRMLGRCPDPQKLYQPPLQFRRRLLLPSEVSHAQGLLFALQRLVLELCGWLKGQGAGVQAFSIHLFHHDDQYSLLTIGIHKESRDAAQFICLLREHLERLQLENPVTEVELHALQAIKLDAQPLGLFGETERQGRAELLDRLRARLGDEAVRGLSAVAEHRPEYAWRYSKPGDSRKVGHGQRRPLWLLPVPRQLKTRNGRPWLQGELKLQPGRERIEAGWWDGHDIARDYFIAVSPSGSHYWIYRELTGEQHWYLQGLFE
jgi:protein ImuB